MANGDGKSGGSVSERDFGEFLAEMRALEEFRQSYAARHPLARIDREDPDVRRMTEAMAYFTVRAVRKNAPDAGRTFAAVDGTIAGLATPQMDR